MRQMALSLLVVITCAALAAGQQAQRPPLSKDEILTMLSQARPDVLNARYVRQFGIAFEPTDEALDRFQEVGAGSGLLAAVLDAGAPEFRAPLGEQDILAFVANGASGESGVRWIRRHGIDFQPSEEFLAKLRAQGAKDVLLSELRVISPKPCSKQELLWKLSSHKLFLEGDIRERGIDFDPSPENLAALHNAGASEAMLQTVQNARRLQPFVPQFAATSPPNPASSDADRYALRVTQDPRPIHRPDSPYADEARRRKVEGSVVLQVAIDEHGDVTDVKETSQPLGHGLDKSAIKTVKTWKFSPAMKSGNPVATTVHVVLSFRLFK